MTEEDERAAQEVEAALTERRTCPVCRIRFDTTEDIRLWAWRDIFCGERCFRTAEALALALTPKKTP